VGDALLRDVASWDERIDTYVEDFAMFGSVCEPYEYLWRIIGSENALYWMATDPELFREFVDRCGKFLVDFTEAQIYAAEKRLTGMFIWGDIAYVSGLLFGAKRWRELFRPHVKAIVDVCKDHGLLTIYHACGDASEIFDDLVEIRIDAFNPLESKAGLDVVDLARRYGDDLAFVGNIDVRALESGDPRKINDEIRYKLQAARRGGWVFQSDHSISSAVAPESYELALQTLRQLGQYPLDL